MLSNEKDQSSGVVEFQQLEFDLSDCWLPADEAATAYLEESLIQADNCNNLRSLRVKDLPVCERPRNRLLEAGPKCLSSSELLAILIGSGQNNTSAIELSQDLLYKLAEDNRDPLVALRGVTAHELMQVHGIGEARAVAILAALELGKRVYLHTPPKGTVIDDPAIAASVLSNDLMYQPVERFAVLMLDVRHRLIAHRVVTIGTTTETLANPKDIFEIILRNGSTRAIVAHNHPSGDTAPSPDDLNLSRQLLKAGKVLNVPILDHLILGNGTYISLRQTTNLWNETPQDD